jgi:protein TonB
MKHFLALFLVLMICYCANAQVSSKDTSKKSEGKVFSAVEIVPEFPGGMQAFSNYLGKNLRYPDVARLIGLNGRLVMSFVVDTSGKVTQATPVNCIGAGCEAEAARLLEASPAWSKGMQDGRPVRVQYSVPIGFTIGGNEKTNMRSLRNSDYGFVFSIKDTLYTIDEAQKILGRSFDPNDVRAAEPFYNYDKLPKFDMPDKKEVYLIIMKSN